MARRHVLDRFALGIGGSRLGTPGLARLLSRLGLGVFLLFALPSTAQVFSAGPAAPPAASNAPETESPPGPATLFLHCKWLPQFQFAGYIVASRKGFYSAAGIDVRLRFDTNHLSTRDLVSRVIDSRPPSAIGIASSDLLLHYHAGQPVVALAALFEHSPLVLVARTDDGVFSPRDLRDKRIMLEPQHTEILAYLRDRGLDPTNWTTEPHAFSVDRFLHGDVSAMSAYETDELYELSQSKVPFALFRPTESGVDFFADVLFTSQEMLRHNKRHRVMAFLAASQKGWEYAFANPTEAIDMIQDFPGHRRTKTRHHLRYEATEMARFVSSNSASPLIDMRNPTWVPRWSHIANVYRSQGLLPVAPAPDLRGFLFRPPAGPAANWLRALLLAFGMVVASILLVSLGKLLESVLSHFARWNHRRGRQPELPFD